ncbi:28S ribosomal protein S27, mitochondrial isoform X2 [Alosa alosa]|nr:28S ribosomal protein S27, mitochondrial isoform X2 [Alosa sapidissima]XP_041957659.1 28S ribosomal protein S27, mitochondrial isoform X2 [Alosa sapidissima]XP_041957660.1 28S ribosomal protein S27, mitochondrial isoform X2 [Alosa sapidissima]XP_048100376.1 28S ribosomal protein S27, mitochondrial isoform X2 [Alosa alosa]
MDRSYERKFPVSSLAIARFVDNISSREEVDQAEYYLYRFRHSPNCWYLRDWTVHSWIRQCLKYGARDKALHTIKNKVQYGIFPDDFTLNLVIDTFLKNEDYQGACSVVEEVMLQEAFDRPTTQILSLFALSKYLALKPDLSLEEQRNLGASLLLAGLKQENSVGVSAQCLGYTLIGKMEMTKGIHAVFRQMPLMWTHGYLPRALAVMETVSTGTGDVKISKDVLDRVESVLEELSAPEACEGEDQSSSDSDSDNETPKNTLDEEDEQERAKLPEYTAKFKALRAQLQASGKEDATSLEALVTSLAQGQLQAAEQPDVELYQRMVSEWEAERWQLIQREKESREKMEQIAQERKAARSTA